MAALRKPPRREVGDVGKPMSRSILACCGCGPTIDEIATHNIVYDLMSEPYTTEEIIAAVQEAMPHVYEMDPGQGGLAAVMKAHQFLADTLTHAGFPGQYQLVDMHKFTSTMGSQQPPAGAKIAPAAGYQPAIAGAMPSSAAAPGMPPGMPGSAAATAGVGTASPGVVGGGQAAPQLMQMGDPKVGFPCCCCAGQIKRAMAQEPHQSILDAITKIVQELRVLPRDEDTARVIGMYLQTLLVLAGEHNDTTSRMSLARLLNDALVDFQFFVGYARLAGRGQGLLKMRSPPFDPMAQFMPATQLMQIAIKDGEYVASVTEQVNRDLPLFNDQYFESLCPSCCCFTCLEQSVCEYKKVTAAWETIAANLNSKDNQVVDWTVDNSMSCGCCPEGYALTMTARPRESSLSITVPDVNLGNNLPTAARYIRDMRPPAAM